ncbi:hypothetical protein ES703_114935 [subsurface metagenome]
MFEKNFQCCVYLFETLSLPLQLLLFFLQSNFGLFLISDIVTNRLILVQISFFIKKCAVRPSLPSNFPIWCNYLVLITFDRHFFRKRLEIRSDFLSLFLGDKLEKVLTHEFFRVFIKVSTIGGIYKRQGAIWQKTTNESRHIFYQCTISFFTFTERLLCPFALKGSGYNLRNCPQKFNIFNQPGTFIPALIKAYKTMIFSLDK